MRLVAWSAALLAGLLLLALAAGQLGLFRGTPPGDLGVHDGKLKPPSPTPNSVSSQADLWPDNPQHAAAAIAPLALRGSGPQTIARLRAILVADPAARIVDSRPDYLRVECTSRWLKFVDDLELWFDPAAGAIQVRSASRLGRSDLGVNRRRVERLRTRLATP